MQIELHTSPGCPNPAAASKAVTDSLTAVGIHVPIVGRVGRYHLADGACRRHRRDAVRGLRARGRRVPT
jgi:hypothetical protein